MAGDAFCCYTRYPKGPMGVTTVQRRIGYLHSFASPVGRLWGIVDKVGRVVWLGFGHPTRVPENLDLHENKYACGELEYQIEQYFRGERREFDLELSMDGTSFQKAVWSRLLRIPYGETATYGEIAQKIGRRDAARAVGNAVAVNPVSIIVPCHRVLPSAGGLGNYALRGLDAERGRSIKRGLLEIEGVLTAVGSASARASA